MENVKLHDSHKLVPQFDGYEWGSDIDTIREIVLGKEGGDPIVDSAKPGIMKYKDTVLGQETEVELHFTLESKRLYSVTIDWYNDDITIIHSIHESLREILIEKYGDPEIVKKEGAWFRWEYNECLLEMRVRTDSNAQAHYRSHYYHRLHGRELVEVRYSKEKDRF